MTSLATSIGAVATTLETGLALFGLAASWSGVGTIVFGAIEGFISVGVAIGETALNTAGSDAGLRDDLICAIYDAIKVDGYVTPTNFSAVLTNINGISYATPGIVGLLHDYVSDLGYPGVAAIQSEGTLVDGDCTDCEAWCYLYDFGTTSQQGWVIITGQDGSWAGDSWVSTNDSGGGGHSELDLGSGQTSGTILPTMSAEQIAIEYVCSSGTSDATHTSFVRFYTLPSTLVQGTDISTLITCDGSNHTLTLSAPAGTFNWVWIRLAVDGTGHTTRVRKVTFRGHGSNPIGMTNCT